ncbi:MAG: translation initiation factor IF-2 [Candidatus Solibacter usitatus]|nr:translation initiation factor IF-2 [Candidatus Solibacter usitatus]
MIKIRINELARELEVKPSRIIELLPEYGVEEKKTHSSSIDEDVALKIRRQILREAGRDTGGEEEESTPSAPAVAVAEAVRAEPLSREVEPAAASTQAAPETTQQDQVSLQPTEPAAERVTTRPTIPIRPPLAGVTPVQQTPRDPPRPTIVAPVTPPQPFAARQSTITAKPVPPPTKPGQILTGPRQSMPAPAADAAAARPDKPLPAGPVIRPSSPIHTPATPGRPIAQPQRPAQPASPVLVAQPVARPVVPPRPDLVARLQQQGQQKSSPSQPIARAPMPGRPPVSPAPGQPPSSYRGPLRPGQPILRPGMQPGSAPGMRPQRPGGRPMHPTAPLPAAPTLLPTDTRRDANKRAKDRHREVEVIEKDLQRRKQITEQVIAPNREITISEGLTVKELSEKLGIRANLVIKKLVDRKIFATINQTLDMKLAEDLSKDFGATTTQMTFEEESTFDLEMAEDSTDMLPRPPVVTIMGHVDHGKTSLLDGIRSTNVVAGEFGGITQHIGAYYVDHKGKRIVFIDTPGHAAFTRMRARGAKVTDIVILVVSADDGVMPQTREAIDHARAAKVPIIVAINKIDKPEANVERIKQQLTELGLMPEDWGGETVTVPLSAKTGQNLDLLLEMILLVTDIQNFRANPTRPAVGVVLEAQLDRGRGPVATVLVRKGTLRVGDYFVCGSVFSRVRAMFDDRGTAIKEAGPSMPVQVNGLDEVPDVGDTFQVVTDTAKAKQIVVYREAKTREEQMKKGSRVTLETLSQTFKDGEIKELNIILKADVGGTCEVLSDALHKLTTEKVKVRVLHTGVGAITETDVLLASASNGIIVGFNVRPEKNATALAEKETVDIRLHTIIYELTDEMKKAMAGLLAPVIKETFKGRAEVRDTFRITKVGTVAGCFVVDGIFNRECLVRLLRDNVVVHTGKISSLKRFKDDASEVRNGLECGISLANYNDVKPGDVIEAFVTEKVAAEI